MSDEGGSTPLRISIPDDLSNLFEVVSLSETGKIKTWFDSNFMAVVKAHFAPFDVIATIKVKDNSAVPVPFRVYVHYQTCDSSMCQLPRWFEVPMPLLDAKPLMLTIARGTPDTASAPLASADTFKNSALHKDSTVGIGQSTGGAPSQPPSGTRPVAPLASADVSTIAAGSIWQFILAAAGFGLLALLTPCVFPMVPITVSFFTKRNAGSKKRRPKMPSSMRAASS